MKDIDDHAEMDATIPRFYLSVGLELGYSSSGVGGMVDLEMSALASEQVQC